jgi:hypothetical protein
MEKLRTKIARFKEATQTSKIIFPTMITSFGSIDNEYKNQ